LRRLVTPASVPLSGFDPLSGFAASQSFAAVFHAATVPGIPPFRVFPRWRSLTPLEAARLPCSYPPVCWGARLEPFAAGFPDSQRFGASCLVPPPTMGFLSAHRSALPGLPGSRACGTAPFRQLHLLRSFTPSCESVRNWIGFPLTSRPILSWDFAPLELSPSTPRILDPPRPESLNTCPSSVEPGLATQRTVAPCAR
jgi:hypothetical protein